VLTHPGHHIGDSWYFIEGDAAHCFYLACPQSTPRHTDWKIEHAVSHDLRVWTRLGTVLQKGAPGEWDNGCIATGSVLHFQERFWMAYTGTWNGPIPGVGLAVSDDLYHWKKLDGGPFTQIDERWYEPIGSGSRPMPHWRDPFLFEHEGRVYHYVCASRNAGEPAQRGTVGLAGTRNMTDWEVLPPPHIEPVVEELECPQLYASGGLFYLVFFASPHWFAGADQTSKAVLTAYSMVAPSPFGPFEMHGDGRVLPPEYSVQPQAAQVIRWRGKSYLIGTLWDDARGDALCDPIEIEFTPHGVKAVKV
jgi:beta-fructofuranosidase